MDDPEAVARGMLARSGLLTGPLRAPDVVGDANHVYVCGANVVRFPRDGGIGAFALEAWCAERVSELGVPVPATIAVDALDRVGFMVQEFVPDTDRHSHADESLWNTLGGYARLIGGAPLGKGNPSGLYGRFGTDPAAAWRAHLDYNLHALGTADPLLGLGVYRQADLPELRAVIQELVETDVAFGLSHGDLSPRNLRVDAGRLPVLIDWGSASAGPVPFTDLTHLLRFHDDIGEPGTADLAAFADGFGLDRFPSAEVISRMRLLAALDLVRWAREAKPERLPGAVAAARSRVRLTLDR